MAWPSGVVGQAKLPNDSYSPPGMEHYDVTITVSDYAFHVLCCGELDQIEKEDVVVNGDSHQVSSRPRLIVEDSVDVMW